MNDNYPLGSDLDSSAPWNDEDIFCFECGSSYLELYDSGEFKGITWKSYKCVECGNIISEEPDYE